MTKIDAGTIRPQPITRHRWAAVLGLELEALRLELSAAHRRGGRSPGLGSGPAWGQRQFQFQ